jgi:hypothetical protein
MATATDLKDDIISYGGDEVAEIGDNQEAFLLWLNNALVNRHEAICELYNKWTTDSFTFSAKGYEASVPTDWDHKSTMVLYTDSDHYSEYDYWEYRFGVHRFESEVASSTTFYRRYRQMPTVYTAMGDTVVEISNPRTKKIIMEEIIAMYLAAQNDLEASNAEQSTLNKANRNS